MDILVDGARELGIILDEEKQKQFEKYALLIEKWNKRINLVRFHERVELFRSHFLDSLWCSKGCEFNRGPKLFDLGSGAGFPGIPLKICFPGIHLVLLEAQRKRCLFLREAVENLGLDNCSVIQGRAEEIAYEEKYRGVFDCVVVRALSSLPVLLELGLPFLAPGGKLVALKGRNVEKEIESSQHACDLIGGEFIASMPYKLREENGRHVVVYRKIGETPHHYPRRPGIPEKKPLVKEKDK